MGDTFYKDIVALLVESVKRELLSALMPVALQGKLSRLSGFCVIFS